MHEDEDMASAEADGENREWYFHMDEERFGPYDSEQEARDGIKRVQVKAKEVHDGVESHYTAPFYEVGELLIFADGTTEYAVSPEIPDEHLKKMLRDRDADALEYDQWLERNPDYTTLTGSLDVPYIE